MLNFISSGKRSKQWFEVGKEYLEVFSDLNPNNYYYSLLIPQVLKTIQQVTKPPSNIFEIGCGQGYLAKILTEMGFSVLASDISPGLIRAAQEQDSSKKIKWTQLDISKTIPDLRKKYDCVVANMVFMYLKNHIELKIAITNAKSCLKKSGHFVVTLCHPCFFLEESHEWFNNNKKELEILNYFNSNNFTISFSESLHVRHYHYTLSEYLRLFREGGFSLVDFIEIKGNEIKNSKIPYYLLLNFKNSRRK